MAALSRKRTLALRLDQIFDKQDDTDANALYYEEVMMQIHKTAIGIFALMIAIIPSSKAFGEAEERNQPSSLRIYPAQAVMNAAAVAPMSVHGVFEMKVRGTGRKNGWLFLNSEADYRDPRCLTIAISPILQKELLERFGIAPETHLSGKTIAVLGGAKRVRIDFTNNGRSTDKYYYQTHVRLDVQERLTVEGEITR